MTQIAPAIIIKNAYLRYSNQVLFDDLHCTLPAGQTTCLLGPSGIGKSSLLRIIASLNNYNCEQRIIIETSDNQPLKDRLTLLSQSGLLLPWLTVLDNVILGFKLRNQKLPIEQARELLIQIGLDEALDKYPAQLSGGMRQRVALVRTLMEDKPVVLMDEPFSALDTITRLRLQELAAKLLVNRTVLLITHDPFEALRLGHQILIMSGKPAKLDKPLQLSGMPPRAANDENLLCWQGKILEQLTKQFSCFPPS